MCCLMAILDLCDGSLQVHGVYQFVMECIHVDSLKSDRRLNNINYSFLDSMVLFNLFV